MINHEHNMQQGQDDQSKWKEHCDTQDGFGEHFLCPQLPGGCEGKRFCNLDTAEKRGKGAFEWLVLLMDLALTCHWCI